MKRFIHFSIACAMVLSFVPASADWPQFQGPHRDGIATQQGLARTWPDGGPRMLWSTPVGEGFAGAAIRGHEVFFLDRIGSRQDVLRCLDLESGKENWRFAYDAPGEVSYNGSRTAPTVTDEHIYTVGMTGQFYCIDRKTHKPVWQIDLARQYPPVESPGWGYSQSPSIYKNLVIVAPQSANAFVAAFDRATGKRVWATKRLGDLGYSTPVVAKLCGIDQVIMVAAGSGGVTGLAADDGRQLWNYSRWECRIPIPFVTPLPGDRVFVTGEYGAGSAMLQLTGTGGRIAVQELYKTDECESQIHQPLLYDDHLYMNSNGNSRGDGMLCMTLDGKVRWRTRDTRGLPRFERGGLLMADGLIVSLDGARGTLHLVEPSPAGYKELARAPMFDGQQMWAPMAISDGKLVLRSQTLMKCLDLRNP